MDLTNFADRLLAACDAKAPVCVGLDPVVERLPDALSGGGSPADAFESFCRQVVDAVAPHVAAVKPQWACFERLGPKGVAVCHRLVEYAKQQGLIVVSDAKRGDIGISSDHYAKALLAGDAGADALTVSPYLGSDALEPFVKVAADDGKGLFVLVRTSNPGSDDLQNLPLAGGGTVAQAVGAMVHTLGQGSGLVGELGYSSIGAVVGATKPDDLATMRQAMPRAIFLLPGVGAQGGDVASLSPCFDAKGRGGLITASRSVLYAFADDADSQQWATVVADAASQLADQVRAAIK